jgi:cytochrome P450
MAFTCVIELQANNGVKGLINILYRAVYRLYFHPLRSFPGPKSWAISYIPFSLKVLAGDVGKAQLELHRKYGKVVRTGPESLSYCDSVVWKDAWSHRKGHAEFAKASSQANKSPRGVSGILGANTVDHRRFRRQLAPAFSDKAMREQQPAVLKHADLLVKGLREHAEKEPQDLVTWFNWTTFDIIGRLAFGESFGCLEKTENHSWIETIFGSMKAGTWISSMDRVGLGWLKPFIIPKRAIEIRMKNYQFSEDKIKNRLALGDENGDFWDNVLKQKDEQGRMSMPEMTANASNIVLGGSETTATLLSGCIYMLLRHPPVMENVMAELRQHFSSSDEIDLFSVSHLTYTLAVLDETMRIYPPVPTQAPRGVPKGGDTIGGVYIPEGTKITMCQYAVNHLGSNFKRPEEFLPERFTGDETFKDDHFSAFQPFSAGPRNCIGKNLAYAEMRLILAKVLWNFEFDLVDKTGNWLDQKIYILVSSVTIHACYTPDCTCRVE